MRTRRAFKFGTTYNFTDFLTGTVTFYDTWDYKSNLYQSLGGTRPRQRRGARSTWFRNDRCSGCRWTWAGNSEAEEAQKGGEQALQAFVTLVQDEECRPGNLADAGEDLGGTLGPDMTAAIRTSVQAPIRIRFMAAPLQSMCQMEIEM